MTTTAITEKLYLGLVPAYGELDADEIVAEFVALHDAGNCEPDCPICQKQCNSYADAHTDNSA